jgi:exonuclease III
MDNHNRGNSRKRKILCCNLRGINSQPKLTAIKSKISETGCDIVCLQETKKELFDLSFIKKFCPQSFDCFEFIPSVGASGGTVVIWKSSRFNGHDITQNSDAMSLEFVSTLHGCSPTFMLHAHRMKN